MIFNKLLLILIMYNILQVNTQSGPDPWHYESKSPETFDHNVPPDIRMPPKRQSQTENKLGIAEWFFKRTLAIVLKGGNTEIKEDGSVDISLHMNFNSKQWETLDEALKSDSPLSEDTLRRSVGYVEESIYKPSITERIVLTWGEYIQVYLAEYKTYITWTLLFLSLVGVAVWLWSHMSHRHAIVLLIIIFYAYEVVISYKEAEQQELEKFISAVNKCNWYFWTSTCDVPPPNPLVFMKHMNPLKIGIRMFTTALAEPIVVFSDTVDTMFGNFTAGLMYPFDKIMFAILAILTKISMIFLFIMILFNFILNIGFNLNVLGFLGVSIKNKKSSHFGNHHNIASLQPSQIEQKEGISEATLDKILNVCSLALSNTPVRPVNKAALEQKCENKPIIRRSASTGRMPNSSSFEMECLALENTVRRRKLDGSGDA